ncbi:hypothetical protein CLV98_105113 [Dyadobacter jejuensis]|uniref:Uncharacterized protein n=1 Tax=Dyadobacter jejuensis TaxID=1082580 RepID=A0A316AJJ1_9BACT|nr:hypothetical protein CLV98_105113 [Dyadobacter jejuensis]
MGQDREDFLDILGNEAGNWTIFTTVFCVFFKDIQG